MKVCVTNEMAKTKYIEFIPRKHIKIFKNKYEAYHYWKKRFYKFNKYETNNANFNPKDYFHAQIITLNKDGTARKEESVKFSWLELGC